MPVYQRIEAPLLIGLIIIIARMYNTVCTIRRIVNSQRYRPLSRVTKNRSLILERFPSGHYQTSDTDGAEADLT